MLVSGFTIIRNGLKYDFPFLESIRSCLPICDEFVACVGDSEDATRQAIEQLRLRLPREQGCKIRIVESDWRVDDQARRVGGRILAEQTNLALGHCRGRWGLYLQADEVLHEADLPGLRKQIEELDANPRLEGLVLEYLHFYASYDVIQTSRASYRREIRAVRNGLGIRSTGDAQSFRHTDGRKLAAALSRARVYHYGWVRPQPLMREKTGFMDTLYHRSATADRPATGDNCLYKRFVGLRQFTGTHPEVMRERVRRAPSFDFSAAPRVFELEDAWKVVSGWFETLTGIRPFEYKNYRLIR